MSRRARLLSLLPTVLLVAALVAVQAKTNIAPTTTVRAAGLVPAPPAEDGRLHQQLELRRRAELTRFYVDLAAEQARIAAEEAAQRAAVARSRPRAASVAPIATRRTAAHVAAAGGACGDDLPPCWVYRRESGMARDPLRVWNGMCYYPVGYAGSNPCGSTASGRWQILRSTWAGFGGYLNAADAPESVQNAKARALWAGGAGCSHWSACG